jgi:hypothetical protein
MQFRGMPGLGRSLALPAGLVALALAGVVGWWASERDRWVGIAAVLAALFALVRAARAIRALIARRRRADDWLRTATGRVVPPAYEWRAAQLVSQHEPVSLRARCGASWRWLASVHERATRLC